MHAKILSIFTLFCLFLLAAPVRAASDRQDLPATMNAGSLQANLVKVLERIHLEDSRSVEVIFGQGSKSFRLKDSRSALTCAEISPSAPAGMVTIQVQRFRCSFEGVSEVEELVMDGRSTQALLFDALAQIYLESRDSVNGLAVKAVKHPNGKARGFALSDGNANLACFSLGGTGTGLGMVAGPAVQTYQCLVNFQ